MFILRPERREIYLEVEKATVDLRRGKYICFTNPPQSRGARVSVLITVMRYTALDG